MTLCYGVGCQTSITASQTSSAKSSSVAVKVSGADFAMIYSTTAIVSAFACSTAIGMLFGFLPARNAARLDPVVALTRE